jgi:hypothetical protein
VKLLLVTSFLLAVAAVLTLTALFAVGCLVSLVEIAWRWIGVCP